MLFVVQQKVLVQERRPSMRIKFHMDAELSCSKKELKKLLKAARKAAKAKAKAAKKAAKAED